MNNTTNNSNLSEQFAAAENILNLNSTTKENFSQNQEQNADNITNANNIFSNDGTLNRQTINCYNDILQADISLSNEVSSEMTNATYESLENVIQSDATLEISTCLSDDTEPIYYIQPDKNSSSNLIHEKEYDSQHTSAADEVSLNTSKTDEKGIYSSNVLKTETETSLISTSEINGENSQNSSDLSTEEYDGSEENSASNGSMDLVDMYPNALKWQLRDSNPQLPNTVTILEAPGGGKVYLVGTAHFSTESQDDVAKTIRATQPDVVMVELCKSRMYILSQDENVILEEAKNMNLDRIRAVIRQSGVRQGILSLLLLSMCAHITKELGMAPGGEFRRAFQEARQIPQCVIQLGDRPIRITMERTLSSLSLWMKLRIAWYLLTCREPITKEDVERYKNKDLLEKLLSNMAGDFPELSQIMIQERDLYLAYSLRIAAKPCPALISSQSEGSPTVVVGVVGMGHIPGIVENWETVSEEDIPPILSIPKPSRSSIIIKHTIRFSMYGLILYGVYRWTPKSLLRKPINLFNRLWTR